ncbi:MAG: pyridoxal-phosphate dependent enzyme [Planctomycetes bacterium]|nr:pyridoxal-phosphate dependent enzyme [Planctomycetota bacterium]
MPDHQRRVYDNILELSASEENPTPLVRLERVVPFEHTRVYAKLEWYNPFGAVKDRIAQNLVRDAEEKALLGEGQQLVEPTSGNTGMGLAMICNARGYGLTTPLSNKIPLEKRTVLRFFGADVVELEDNLCPAPGAPEGAIAKARELAGQPGFHMLNQYANEANPEAHYKTTGPEIWRQSEGKVTHFAAGLGTCGTVTGTGRFLKEKNPDVKVLGIHPVEGHDIPGVRSIQQLEQTELFAPDEYDDMCAVDNQEAFELCLRLNREDSIIAGPSSAMALAGALKLVPDAPGNVVVVIFPDNVFKYASSVVKHLPQVRSGGPVDSVKERRLDRMVENVRDNEALRVSSDAGFELWEAQAATFIDVRDFDQHRKGHIPDSVTFPLSDSEQYLALLPEDRGAPIITFCNRGNLSLSGVLYLTSKGYRDVRSLDGGVNGWREAGRPVAET